MSADVRGFEYALEPLRRRRQWKLESAQAALGRVNAELRDARQAVTELRARYEEQRHHAAEALVARPDPATHRRNVDWLATQRRSIHQAEEVVARLAAKRTAAADRCLAEQKRLELLERHRERCLSEFTAGAESRAYSEADREWLARGAHAQGTGARVRRGLR